MTADGYAGPLARAVELHRAGRLDAAAALYEDILAQAPHHFDALHLLGVIRHQHGQWEAAVKLIGAAVIQQAHPVAYMNLGLAQAALGLHGDAIASYDRCLALDPASVEAHNNRGLSHSALGRHRAALTDFTCAARLGADRPEFFNNLGSARRALGEPAEAVRAY